MKSTSFTWNFTCKIFFLNLLIEILFTGIIYGQSLQIQINNQTEMICPSTLGSISSEIIYPGTPPYTITLLKTGNNPVLLATNTSNTNITVNNLESGEYTIKWVDSSNPPTESEATTIITDNANWPFIPYVKGEAFGVDMCIDMLDNVYASGFWMGDIAFDPLSLMTADDWGTYLIKFDKCATPLWQAHISTPLDNINLAGLGVTSICLDNEENIIMCGTFDKSATFQNGSSTIILNAIAISGTNAVDGNNGFVAKFSKTTGDCLWATKFDGNGNSIPKGVTSDYNNNIFVIGYFDGPTLFSYSADDQTTEAFSETTISNLIPNTYTFYPDNFLAVFDATGENLVLVDDNSLSSQFEDKSGGISCFRYSQYVTAVLITGSKNSSFLGQRWDYDQTNPSTITKVTDFNIPVGSNYNTNHIGHTVESNAQSGTRRAYFGGHVKGQEGASHPFLANFTIAASTSIVSSYDFDFITNQPSYENECLDLVINQTTGDVLYTGFMNEDGEHPIGSGFGPYWGTPDRDFFIDRLQFINGSLNGVWMIGSDSHTSWFDYHTDDFAICSNNSGKAYFTGAYLEKLTTPSCYNLSITGDASQNCYIARLFEQQNYGYVDRPVNVNSEGVVKEKGITIYPNPAKDKVIVSNSIINQAITKIEIISSDGRILKLFNNFIQSQNLFMLDVDDLNSGIFLMKFYFTEGVEVRKIIIK
jgi:hypothetical protein